MKEINSTFITLVAKKDNPSEVVDFRPIACCNVIYKCITKIIALRMKGVLKSLIHPSQSAFVSGRSIQDNILLAHEIVRNYHREVGTPRCTLKIDLKKAYDTVNWQAILITLKKMGFPELFVNWIGLCITSPKYSILINGSPYGYFGASRGLRQGCPLSPYLFVMVMELMSIIFQQQISQGKFGLHPRCKLTKLTHLCFADDVLVFFKGSCSAATTLKNCITEFTAYTGLEMNIHKTSLFSSVVDADTLMEITSILDCSVEKLPIRYLGMPLLSTRLSYNDCLPLISRILSRINAWKAKFVAYPGRLMLIKTVLAGMVFYWMSCFILPKRVIKEITSIFKKFLWAGCDMGKKYCPVKWTSICLPVHEGGLGVRDIEVTNIAANLRHVWNLVSGKESIWTD